MHHQENETPVPSRGLSSEGRTGRMPRSINRAELQKIPEIGTNCASPSPITL